MYKWSTVKYPIPELPPVTIATFLETLGSLKGSVFGLNSFDGVPIGVVELDIDELYRLKLKIDGIDFVFKKKWRGLF